MFGMFKKSPRPTVILLKFLEPGDHERKRLIQHFFGTNNVAEPEKLDSLTFKVLWVNPNFPPKDIDAEKINASKEWKAGEVFYCYAYPE